MKKNIKKNIVKDGGFTLIELIIIMVIISILVLLASPKFMKYIEQAKLTHIKNDVKVVESVLLSEQSMGFIKDNNKDYFIINEVGDKGLTVDSQTLTDFKEKKGLKIDLDIINVNSKLAGSFYYDKESREVFYYDKRLPGSEDNSETTNEINIGDEVTVVLESKFAKLAYPKGLGGSWQSVKAVAFSYNPKDTEVQKVTHVFTADKKYTNANIGELVEDVKEDLSKEVMKKVGADISISDFSYNLDTADKSWTISSKNKNQKTVHLQNSSDDAIFIVERPDFLQGESKFIDKKPQILVLKDSNIEDVLVLGIFQFGSGGEIQIINDGSIDQSIAGHMWKEWNKEQELVLRTMVMTSGYLSVQTWGQTKDLLNDLNNQDRVDNLYHILEAK